MADQQAILPLLTRQLEISNGMKVLLDEFWFHELAGMRWTAFQCRPDAPIYARRLFTERNGDRRSIFMHRLIMGVIPCERIDHRNRNSLDNRIENLRVCTHRQNAWNRGPDRDNKARYKGVYPHRDRWGARISDGTGEQTFLGYFETPELAAKAYNESALLHHGEFAWLNEVPGATQSMLL